MRSSRLPWALRFSLVVLAALLVPAPLARADANRVARGDHGIVVSASSHASQAGVDILKARGNAVDAAVATGFALTVTHPLAAPVGGGGFLVAQTHDGDAIALDFREVAPAKAHRDMFLDSEGNVVEGASTETVLAVGVPGSVDGYLRLVQDYGSGVLSRAELLAPAIRLAKNGFEMTENFAETLNDSRELFSKDPAASKIFIRPNGARWKAGDRMVQPDLARTLEAIAREGRPGFYSGAVADGVVATMRKRGGFITHEDLENYGSVYREPVRGTFRGFEVVSMPPPSSGGVLLVHMLNMLEPYPLEAMGWNSPEYVHLLTEVERRAYADRATHLGDPDFWNVPMDSLLSKRYATKRRLTIDPERATPSSDVSHGAVVVSESGDTTHYSIVDSSGNAVAVTVTLNASFGCGIVAEGTGVLLNNEMDDFSAKPGVPNLYGLVGGEANAVEAGKRMLSSMTPTVVLDNGRPRLVAGSPGGSTIITTVLQVILNVLVHNMPLEEAVAAPRVHSQWLPDRITIEERAVQPAAARRLTDMGHEIEVRNGALGNVNAIGVNGGEFIGVGDVRWENSAVGY